MESKSMEISRQYPPDDEIDLFELFSSLFQQWRWLVGITLLGVAVSVIVALQMPKLYEVTAKIAVPNTADVAAMSVRGYGDQTAGALFKKLHQNLASGDELSHFISAGQWAEKFNPEGGDDKLDAGTVSKINKDFSVTQLAPLKEKGDANAPAPTLLAVTLWSEDEQLAVVFLTDYIGTANERLIDSIRNDGLQRRVVELERIRAEIELLRNNEAVKRGLVVQKMDADNRRKIEALSQSIDLLVKKQQVDDELRLAVLNEALTVALTMKIKTPTTIEAMAESKSKASATEISVTTNARSDLFLMGSDYIQAQIKNLQTRKHKSLFVKEISSIKKQIGEVQGDTVLAALKARKNDDPFIEGLPVLLKKIDELERLTFDYSGVQLYRWDAKASPDGQAEKPRRGLIVAVGSVLSMFIGVFVALIAGAIKRRKALA